MTHYKGLPSGSSKSHRVDLSRVMRFVGFGFLLITASIIVATQARAASLGLSPGPYDVETIDANVNYTYTQFCLGDDGGATSGLCGSDNGLKGQSKVTYDGAVDLSSSFGLFTITNAGGALDQILQTPDGAGFLNNDSYSLIANFDGSGNFVDGTVEILGFANNPPDFGGTLPADWLNSGIILTADIDAFGFAGVGNNGVFEFSLINVLGDLSTYIAQPYGSELGAGVIVNATGLTHGGIGPAESWDDDAEFFQTGFSSTSNVDTFVPVPAAVWLFGSGLIGLAGLARRRMGSISK